MTHFESFVRYIKPVVYLSKVLGFWSINFKNHSLNYISCIPGFTVFLYFFYRKLLLLLKTENSSNSTLVAHNTNEISHLLDYFTILGIYFQNFIQSTKVTLLYNKIEYFETINFYGKRSNLKKEICTVIFILVLLTGNDCLVYSNHLLVWNFEWTFLSLFSVYLHFINIYCSSVISNHLRDIYFKLNNNIKNYFYKNNYLKLKEFKEIYKLCELHHWVLEMSRSFNVLQGIPSVVFSLFVFLKCVIYANFCSVNMLRSRPIDYFLVFLDIWWFSIIYFSGYCFLRTWVFLQFEVRACI